MFVWLQKEEECYCLNFAISGDYVVFDQITQVHPFQNPVGSPERDTRKEKDKGRRTEILLSNIGLVTLM